MRKLLIVPSVVVLASVCVLNRTDFAQTPDRVDFGRDVQPILRQNCYGCHGPTQQMNGFRLDRRKDAMRGGTIAVIGPGNSDASRLYLRLVGNAYGQQMPPTGALSAETIAIIKAWIDQGAEWPDALAGDVAPAPPDARASALMNALRAGDRAGFAKLAAANPQAMTLKGDNGSTPLMYAVLYSDAATVKQVLDGGADPNVKNEAGATALMWAAADLDKTRLLVDRGADVNAKSDNGRTPLLIAAGVHGNSGVVSVLLEHGAKASVKAPGLIFDTTPLAEAAFAGDDAIVRQLIGAGADPRAAGIAGLAFALRSQCRACAELLFKDAPPPLVTGTMLLAAPPLGPALATEFLLAQGADPNAKDPAGHSILMLAAASDAMPVNAVKALLDRGADVNASDASGMTALTLAKQRGRTPVVDLLVNAGAKDAPDAAAKPDPPSPAASPSAAVARTLPLLQQNDVTFLKKSGCVSCHNNTLTAMTVAAARGQKLPVDEAIAQSQTAKIGAYLDDWRERVLQGEGIPGDADTIGYILVGLAAQNYPATPATDAMVRFLKRVQLPNGQWMSLAHRPPIESSAIEVTATAMKAMQAYAPAADRAAYDARVRDAATWLAAAEPASTEDRAFQLLGLRWSSAQKALIDRAATALVAEQRADGGWAQIPTLGSDAYATGQALVALRQSGALPATDPAYQKGVAYLLQTQLADGSWHVRTRALPIQPHFESGFPHGRDQFISAAATNWATMALAFAAKPSAATDASGRR
jgi:ankyrin repeat protein